MTRLARYLGPLAAWRGVVGRAVSGGVEVCGRTLTGQTTPARYMVDGTTYDTWDEARTALAGGLSPGMAALVSTCAESPAGLEVVDEAGNRRRLTVV